MVNFLEIALRNVARGWPVFPLLSGNKEPRIPKSAGGQGYKDATLDAAQINEWWAKWPACNVGFWPGGAGLTVLDIDTGLTDFEQWRAWCARNGIPDGYSVRTGRRPQFRVQMYFRGTRKDTDGWELDGCKGDIRSLGGYVCAEGSVHPSGEKYAALTGTPEVLADMPAIVAQLKKPERAAAPGEPFKKLRPGDGQHRDLTSQAGRLRNMGLDGDELAAALIPVSNARHDPPLPFADIEHIAKSIGAKPLPAIDPKVTIGSKRAAVEIPPEDPDEKPDPVYPIEVWDGTEFGDFANLCAHDNNVPRKMYVEAFRTVTGAVVGNHIECTIEGVHPRAYTVMPAPYGKGKGTSIRRATAFYDVLLNGNLMSPPLLFKWQESTWRRAGIGAEIAAGSSMPGLMRIITPKQNRAKEKKGKAQAADKPPVESSIWQWQPMARVITVAEELKELLANFYNEKGVGTALEGVVCELWDGTEFTPTSTDARQEMASQVMYSILGGITPDDWQDLLSRGQSVGSGFMSRLNIVGTRGEWENVSDLKRIDFGPLRQRFIPRIHALKMGPVVVDRTDGARGLVAEWFNGLKSAERSNSRFNIHAWRAALWLAWLKGHAAITEQDAAGGIALAQYQWDTRDYYTVKPAENPIAKYQEKIRKALQATRGKRATLRELKRVTHADRVGTHVWTKALEGMIRSGELCSKDEGKSLLVWVVAM